MGVPGRALGVRSRVGVPGLGLGFSPRSPDARGAGGAKNRTPPLPGHPHPRLDPRLVPVHPATEQLKAQRIRQWVEQAMGWVGNVVEPLPAELRVRRELAGAADAIKAVHFPRDRGGRRAGSGAAGFRRAVSLPGDPGDSEAESSGVAAGAKAGEAGGDGGAMDRVVAVRADSGSAQGVRRDRCGSRFRGADAAAADGGGGIRQDRGGALLDAAGAGSWVPGCVDGAYGDSGRAARCDAGEAAGRRGDRRLRC